MNFCILIMERKTLKQLLLIVNLHYIFFFICMVRIEFLSIAPLPLILFFFFFFLRGKKLNFINVNVLN